MYNDFLKEAFQRLNEETFDIDDKGLEKLDDFRKVSDEEVDTEVKIIDDKATSEDELKDSYVGDVIVECPICHSYLFKAPDEIKLEDDLCNVNDECPYCCEVGGFKIIGKVAPFAEETEEEEEKPEEEEKSEESEEEVKEEEKVEEEESEEPKEEESKEEELKEEKSECESEEVKEDSLEECGNSICEGEVNDEKVKLFNECLGEEAWDSYEFDDELPEDERVYTLCKGDKCVGDFQIINGRLYDFDKNNCVDCDESCKKVDESIEEDVKATIETDNGVVEVDDDSTKIKTEIGEISATEDEITIKPEEESADVVEEEPAKEEEQVAELSDEEIAEIENNNEEAPAEEVASEEEVAPEEEIATEEDASEEEVEEPAEEDVDVNVEDIKEESFDVLGTSYLKRVYENVESFKTVDITSDGENTIMLEGVITFKSGNTKNTSFVFESVDITKEGKARFVGKNESICKGNKAFTLRGTLNNGEYIAESLSYNYHTKTPSGKTTRVSGTVNIKD